MFATLKSMLADLGGAADEPARFDDNDFRLMVTALMVHAAAIDGRVNDIESQRLRAIVKDRFRLDDDEADELIASATRAEQEAIDLYRFTSTLNRLLDEPGRAKVIEMMWQIVFADGKASEFEDNLVWRAADLLHISRDERIALRQWVQDRQSS